MEVHSRPCILKSNDSLLTSLLKNICGQVRQLQLGFDAESPRSDFTHECSSQGIDRVEFWGQNDSARHRSKLARLLPAKLKGGKRVASSDLRVHVPRMGTSSQSSLYSSMKLELLALKWAVTEKFRDYLLGATFSVFTDNNPLSYLNSAKLAAAEMRWASQLAQFNFDIKYRSGKDNANADALSRQSTHAEDTLQDVSKSTSLQEVAKANTRVVQTNIRMTRAVEVPSAVSTLPGYTSQELANLQKADTVISRFLAFWRHGSKPDAHRIRQETRATKMLLNKWDRIQEIERVLYLRTQEPGQGEQIELLLPAELQLTVLTALHQGQDTRGRSVLWR